MIMRSLSFVGGLVLIVGVASQGNAIDGEIRECDICTCQSGTIVCVERVIAEVLEEQVVCSNACATVGSTHGSRETVSGPCADVPECGHRAAPAANPLWLGVAAAGLLVFGGLALRRGRRRRLAV